SFAWRAAPAASTCRRPWLTSLNARAAHELGRRRARTGGVQAASAPDLPGRSPLDPRRTDCSGLAFQPGARLFRGGPRDAPRPRRGGEGGRVLRSPPPHGRRAGRVLWLLGNGEPARTESRTLPAG